MVGKPVKDALVAADQFFALTMYWADRLTVNGASNIAIFLDSYAPAST